MAIDTKAMRSRAEKWLTWRREPGRTDVTRENAIGEELLALDVLDLIAEVERLRLSDEEREAVRWTRNDVNRELNSVEDDGCKCAVCKRRRLALAVLDRLTKEQG